MALAVHPLAGKEDNRMNIDIVAPIIALIAGILILIYPRILNYVVAVYLIIVGILGLLPYVTGR
jgi:hypothetical protein